MRARLRAVRQQDDGFTLTELLIVIVVLGVLAGIVVFAIGNFSDKGTLSACKADKRAVEVAAEAYRAQKSAYPDSSGTPATTPLQKLVAEGYLKAAPSTTNGYTITLVTTSGATPTATVTGTLTAGGNC